MGTSSVKLTHESVEAGGPPRFIILTIAATGTGQLHLHMFVSARSTRLYLQI